jgi:hypothetical protein
VSYLDHVNPLAFEQGLLLLPELYEMNLAAFVYRSCVLCHNLNLFVNSGFVPLSLMYTNNNNVLTRNKLCNYFVPFARTSLRKNSILHQCIRVWNSLPLNIKCKQSIASFKSGHFNILLDRYGNN